MMWPRRAHNGHEKTEGISDMIDNAEAARHFYNIGRRLISRGSAENAIQATN
jgi:hypothetical protein